MRPSLGFVSAKGCFRISRSLDGIGAMAKTPNDLAPLIEAILTPEARARIPDGGFKGVMKGNWEGMRVGFVESTWGGADEEKWGGELVVSVLVGVSVKRNANGGRNRNMKVR
jgi:amidase